MQYFKHLPLIFKNDNVIANVFSKVKIQDIITQGTSFYKDYEIPDGYRSDNVSSELYNSSYYYWTLYIVNNMTPNTWPMKDSAVGKYIEDKYKGQYFIEFDDIELYTLFYPGEKVIGRKSNATGTIIKTEHNLGDKPFIILKDVKGKFQSEDIILESDHSRYKTSITGMKPIKDCLYSNDTTYFQHYQNENDKRRKIKIIRPEYIAEFVSKYREVVNGSR